MAKGLPAFINTQLRTLREYQDLQFQVKNIQNAHANAEFADRFVVEVPCALARVPWHVVYSAGRPEQPPDFVFPPEDEQFQPLLDSKAEQLCSALRRWEAEDPQGLLRLLLLLRARYLEYQRELAERIDDARVNYEIGTMGHTEDLELYLLRGSADKAQEVQLTVPLTNVDLSPLLMSARNLANNPYFPPSPSSSTLLLQVRFPLQRKEGKTLPPFLRVVPPLAVQHVLDDVSALLPPWTENTCLMEYVPILQHVLQEHVSSLSSSRELRKSFLEALPPAFGRPLEVDPVHFRKATFFIQSAVQNGKDSFLVHFSLPLNFPKQQPTIVFQSTLHFDELLRPLLRTKSDSPWSPRWKVEEMVERTARFVAEEVERFKDWCVESLTRRVQPSQPLGYQVRIDEMSRQ